MFLKIFKDFKKSSDTPTMDELNALDGEILYKLGVTSESRFNSRLIRGLFDESIFIWTDFVRMMAKTIFWSQIAFETSPIEFSVKFGAK